MNDLINTIKASKVRAGEDAVCARLEELGLINKPKETELEADARRYRYLRDADINSIFNGGLFAGKTPDNLVLNGSDLDNEIDSLMEE